MKAIKIELLFSDAWVEYEHGRNLFMIPRHMLTPVQAPSLESYRNLGLPFINVVRNGEDVITEVELSAGVIRAMPLFYALYDSVLHVSDFPEPIGDKLKLSMLDRLSVLEFLSFGYVNSNRTLVKGLYSLQAGEVLLFKAGEMDVRTEYLYDGVPIVKRSYKELRSELRNVAEEITHDFITSVKGKIPVVPLSSGYDSRFITAMLKMNGVKDAICLTYGIPGNFESEASIEVAKRLGYESRYVPHSTEKWERVFHEDLFLDYAKFSSRYVSAPHYQEMLSLLELSDLFAKNEVVFVPGNAGDFVAGSHIVGSAARDLENAVDSILRSHYAFRMPPVNESIRKSVRAQCREFQTMGGHLSRIPGIWDWRQRQAKYIANSHRLYEFFDHLWAIPLWDKRFADFWSRVSLKWKFVQRLYDEFLEEEIFSKLNIDFDRHIRQKRRTGFRRTILRNTRLHKVARKVRRSFVREAPLDVPAFRSSHRLLLDIASSWSGANIVDSICRQEFHGRTNHPIAPVPEFLLSYLLSERELLIGEIS